MRLDEALAQPGPLLVVRERAKAPDARPRISIHRADGERLVSLAESEDPADRERAFDAVRRGGARLGDGDPRAGKVWCFDSEGFQIWAPSGTVHGVRGGAVRRPDGQAVETGDVELVVSFVDDARRANGVMIVADEEEFIVAEERDPDRVLGPVESRWISELGATLAAWLGARHVDELDERSDPP
ncbi:MAG: hypothetical protein HS111_20390 [Kofleriaceae bacterium]|nr:hypothetical protein [Kofleriaceae bacterium]MCL4225332.1 hypothetical protein [Myxococcales bacterium]